MGLIFYNKEFELGEIESASLLEKINKLFPISTKNITKLSDNYINNNYDKSYKLNTSLDFLKYNLSEIIKPQDRKEGFGLQIHEINLNLNRSLYLCNIGFYKESIFNLRSALDLTLYLTSYYTLYNNYENYKSFDEFINDITREEKLIKLKKWSKSEKNKLFDTPYNNVFCKILENDKNFKKLFCKTRIKIFYQMLTRKLNNFIHTKGMHNSNLKLNNYKIDIEYPPTFNDKSLKIVLDLFIDVVQVIAILSVTARPELINEDLAYQIEIQTQEPLIGSGLWGNCTSIFFKLIPFVYKDFFNQFHFSVKNE